MISDDNGQVNHVTYSCAVGLLIHGFEAVAHASANRQPNLDEIFAPVAAGKSNNRQTGTLPYKKKNSLKEVVGNIFNSISKFFKESDNQA